MVESALGCAKQQGFLEGSSLDLAPAPWTVRLPGRGQIELIIDIGPDHIFDVEFDFDITLNLDHTFGIEFDLAVCLDTDLELTSN